MQAQDGLGELQLVIRKPKLISNREGLNPTGAINGGCSSSGGQVYARTFWIYGRFGIYYTWYFPKDQIALGPAGHRHDWVGSTPRTAPRNNHLCHKKRSIKLAQRSSSIQYCTAQNRNES